MILVTVAAMVAGDGTIMTMTITAIHGVGAGGVAAGSSSPAVVAAGLVAAAALAAAVGLVVLAAVVSAAVVPAVAGRVVYAGLRIRKMPQESQPLRPPSIQWFNPLVIFLR